MSDRPTDDEIQEVIENAWETENRWPSMSYEEGVRNALQWVQGDGDNPFEEN